MDILRLACSVSLSGRVEVVGIAAVAAVDIVELLGILLLCCWYQGWGSSFPKGTKFLF